MLRWSSANAGGCRPVGRGRLDTGRSLCAVASQSAGDQQLREPAPRNYVNSVRAGYSYDINDILSTITNTALLRDAADDNFNAFDPYPPGTHRRAQRPGLLRCGRGAHSACRPDAPVRDARRHQRHRVGGDTGRTPRPRGPMLSAGSSSIATIVPPAHPDRSPRRRARRARRPLPQPLAPSARSIIRRTQPATTSSIRTGRTTTRFRQPRDLHWPIRHTFPT